MPPISLRPPQTPERLPVHRLTIEREHESSGREGMREVRREGIHDDLGERDRAHARLCLGRAEARRLAGRP